MTAQTEVYLFGLAFFVEIEDPVRLFACSMTRLDEVRSRISTDTMRLSRASRLMDLRNH